MDFCQICNDNNECTLCFSGYYTHQGSCTSTCPSDYEIDSLSTTKCILKPEVAYQQYLAQEESDKVLIMPSSVLALMLLPLTYFASNVLFALACLATVPQGLALAQIAWHYHFESDLLTKPALPSWLHWAVLGVFIVMSTLYTIAARWVVGKNKVFQNGLTLGSTNCRFNTVTVFSLINKQAWFILYSGLFNLPFTAFSYVSHCSLIVIHIVSTAVSLGLIALGFFFILVEEVSDYSLRMHYSSIDLIIVFLLSVILDIVLVLRADKQPAPAVPQVHPAQRLQLHPACPQRAPRRPGAGSRPQQGHAPFKLRRGPLRVQGDEGC